MDLGEEQGGAFRGAPQRREPTLGSGGPPSPFASIPSPQARPDPLLGPPQAFTPPSQIGEMPGSSLRERALAAQSPEDFAALLSDDSLFGGPSEGTPIDESPAPAPASATQGATQQAARPSKAAGPKFAEQEPALLEEEMPLISALDHVTRHKPPEPTGRPEYDFELRDIDESQFMDWVKQIEGYKPEVYDDVGAAAGYFGNRFGPGEEFDPNLTPEEHLQVGAASRQTVDLDRVADRLVVQVTGHRWCSLVREGGWKLRPDGVGDQRAKYARQEPREVRSPSRSCP